MQPAKIRLSPEETALVLDPHWILTKRSIMEKVGELMGSLVEEYNVVARRAPWLPEGLAAKFPKLSRGENYQGLPYMILDYPAVFDRTNVFALRTFFWWGHYFTLTLHLKGHYQNRYLPSLLGWLSRSTKQEWFVSASSNEWVHAVEGSDYVMASTLRHPDGSAIASRPFVKVVCVISLDQWAYLPALLTDRFSEIVAALNYQDGGRDL